MKIRPFNLADAPKPPGNFTEIITKIENHTGPIALEIGAGNGEHAHEYCKKHRDCLYLAIERTATKFEGLQKRLQKEPLDNLISLRADGALWAAHFLQNQSIDRVFLLYPNPYPKAKQANLRWHFSPFMSVLSSKLKVGASLILATNMPYYYEEAKGIIPEHYPLEIGEEAILGQKFEARTAFERKYLDRGDVCFNLVFNKLKPH